jgi:hypothetical protein
MGFLHFVPFLSQTHLVTLPARKKQPKTTETASVHVYDIFIFCEMAADSKQRFNSLFSGQILIFYEWNKIWNKCTLT